MITLASVQLEMIISHLKLWQYMLHMFHSCTKSQH
jgi:hypothetical protein